MRKDALRLAPEGIYSKLILPNDQIRYLTIETGDLPAGDRIDAARHALKGATPYSVDELAFDICAGGSVTHVAAVALETLDEAETFAVEHGFGPVSFVAAPEDCGFQGEPFFGTTRMIRGTEVDPDTTLVKVIGPFQFPEPETEDSSTGKAPAPEAAAETQDLPAIDAAAQAEPEKGKEPAPAAEQETPSLQEAENTAVPKAPASAEPAPAQETLPPAPPKPLPPAPPAVAPPGDDPVPDSAVAALAGFTSRRSAAPDNGTGTAQQAPDSKTSPAAPPAPAPLTAAGTQAAEPEPAKPLAATNALLAEEKAGQPRTIPPAPAALRAPSPAAPAAPQETPPVRKKPTTGKPRHLGLALTAFVLLLLAAAAVWALFSEDGLFAARPASDSDLPPATAISSGEAPNGETASAAASGTGSRTEEIAPQVSVLADQPDPGIREIGEIALTAPAGADGVPTAEDEAAADGVEPPEEGTDTAFLDPDTLQPGAAETTETEPLDELAQAARYAATGVWPVAPELDEIPAAPGLDELYTASVDHSEIAADAVALPHPETYAADEEPGAIASPAAAGAAFDLDERGLVRATPEGALNPDGITVYLGRPQKVPPPAPERSDPAAEALAEEAARNQVLSRKRPKARPADLAEQVERAQNGGLSRAELASLRPRKRPASLKPAEEEELPVTAQAIASSVVPRGRPANFANLVDRARRNAQNQVQTATAVPAAAVAAPPPIPTTASVARRATVNNAINLRKLNLIGVYGTAANRRALVRLPSGRYKKLQVGDRIDGGKVIAIGESQLQYQKGGRNRTLTMPKS
ncbi:hypothetical protein [Leisingera sp. JC11]|uniref:hypothetical protein n=1 Tax=Leisingera sp. JC11 TaxID=3042469 RepID=UPI003452C60A